MIGEMRTGVDAAGIEYWVLIGWQAGSPVALVYTDGRLVSEGLLPFFPTIAVAGAVAADQDTVLIGFSVGVWAFTRIAPAVWTRDELPTRDPASASIWFRCLGAIVALHGDQAVAFCPDPCGYIGKRDADGYGSLSYQRVEGSWTVTGSYALPATGTCYPYPGAFQFDHHQHRSSPDPFCETPAHPLSDSFFRIGRTCLTAPQRRHYDWDTGLYSPDEALHATIVVDGFPAVGITAEFSWSALGSERSFARLSRAGPARVEVVEMTFVPSAFRVDVVGEGRVVSSPAGIDCGLGHDECEAVFEWGTPLRLTATSDADWGDPGGFGPCWGSPPSTECLTRAGHESYARVRFGLLPPGESCSPRRACASGVCVGGICCASTTGCAECHSCAPATGECVPVIDAIDCAECGSCEPTTGRCVPSTTRSCGSCGLCNGATTDCTARTAGVECRSASTECLVASFCDGVSTDCPAREVRPDGELCTGDGDMCAGAYRCWRGTCRYFGPRLFCDDGDDATANMCLPAAGCVFPLAFGRCRDESDCAPSDRCHTVACVETRCGETRVVGCCVRDEDCADADACTDDVCLGGFCVNRRLVDGPGCEPDAGPHLIPDAALVPDAHRLDATVPVRSDAGPDAGALPSGGAAPSCAAVPGRNGDALACCCVLWMIASWRRRASLARRDA